MTNQHSKFCGNTCPSTSTYGLTNSFCSQQQLECSSELASLTSLLVHLCLTGSDVCEQQSIACFIFKKFEKEINKMSTTFDFIEASPFFISSPTTFKSELIVTKEFKTKKLPNRNSVKTSISFSGENEEEKIKKKSGNISKNIELLNKSFKEEKQNQKKTLKSFPGRLSKSKSLKTKNSFKCSKNESSSSLQRPSSKRKIKQKSNIVGMLKSKSEINLFTKISENKSKLRRPNTTSGGNLTNRKLKSPICSSHKSRQQQKRKFSFDGKNEKQLFKKEINSTNNPSLLEYIIKSFEFTNDSLCLFVFCKLINGYIEYCESLVKQNRLRFLVKLDLISHLLRVIRKRFDFFEKWEILDNLIVDFLAKIILLISEKDKKFVLKVRLSGVLTLLANYLFFNDSIDKQIIFSSQNINLFKLLIKSLNSIRNAQILTAEHNFIKRFVNTLDVFNSYLINSLQTSKQDNLPQKEIVVNQNLLFNNFIEEEQIILDNSNLCLLKMAKLMECLIIFSKNQKNKLLFIRHNILPILKLIFETNFPKRLINLNYQQIVFISLATLRQFAKIEECREQLFKLNILKMCENFIENLAGNFNERKTKIEKMENFLENNFKENGGDDAQLYDSLCSLCLRCLPSKEFPYRLDDFPLKFVLPLIETKNKKILSKLSSPSSSQIVNNFKLSNLVDESDEDSNLWSFNSLNNLEEEEDGEQNNEGLINDKGKEKNKKQKNNLLLPPDISQYSRLKQNELIKYQKFFPEFSLESFKQLIFDEFTNNECCQINEYKQIVLKEWKKINSVGNFVKIANPELFDCGDLINGKEENIFENSLNNSMKQIINEKLIEYKNQKGEEKEEKNNYLPRIVFDLNGKINKELLNNDYLNFESRFESGNLWKAIQVDTNKYELIISPDINQQTLHFQWFYFEVTNMRAGITYIFEIINCLKNISMFSKGMQPVLFSLIEAKKGNIGWRRAGTEISYFRNLFKIPNDDERKENKKIGKNENLVNSKNNGKINKSKKQNNEDLQIMEKRNFSSLRFTLCFPHDEDVCYIAYHFPYTYTKLQSTIEWWISSSSSLNLFFYRQKLCSTLNKNFISLLTITTNKNIKSKQIILITSRVHPGESNSSWIIHGFIQFLLSSHPLAIRARDLFIFKIIPMLNPDGVINGSHRCSLVGQDLNRVWNCPLPILHPSIFHTKALIQYMVEILKMPPFSFIDLHGHSRKPNIFMYGNNPLESWCPTDIANNSQQSKTFSLLPEILAKSSDSFSLKDCSFSITKAKEFSARVSIWRQFKLERVYTCESSYFGFDFGSKAGTQITITDLKRMGAELVEGLVYLREFNRATNLPDETNQKI